MDTEPVPPTVRAVAPVRLGARLLVALLGLSIVAAVLGGRGDSAAAGTDRWYLPTVLPDGLTFASVHEPGALAVPRVHQLYLGEAGVPDPFARRSALVQVTPAAGPVPVDGSPGTEAVVVQGRAAAYAPSTGDGAPGRVQFLDGGLLVSVASHVLGREELVAVADAVRIVDGRPYVHQVVAGLAVVHEAGERSPFLAGSPEVRSVAFADDTGRIVLVASAPGDATRLRALEWWGGRPTVLAGRPAAVLRGGDERPMVVALWLDGDVVVGLSGTLDDAELEQVAGGVRAVDEPTWRLATRGR